MKTFKRLFILFIFPFLFIIGTISMFLSLPIWLLTGKGIMNNICDGMALWVIDFLEK